MSFFIAQKRLGSYLLQHSRRVVLRGASPRCFSVSGTVWNGPEGRPVVKLFTKAQCELCDRVVDVFEQAKTTHPHTLLAVDITDRENIAWLRRYRYDIPVLHIDDAYFAKHRVSLEDVISALEEAGDGEFQPRSDEPDASKLGEL